MAYVPAVLLGLAHVIALARSSGDARQFVATLQALDRLEFLYLAGCLIVTACCPADRSTEVDRLMSGGNWERIECCFHNLTRPSPSPLALSHRPMTPSLPAVRR